MKISALLFVRNITLSINELEKAIESQRRNVRTAYSNHGLSDEYDQEFDVLHQLNMTLMAKQFRRNRALPEH